MLGMPYGMQAQVCDGYLTTLSWKALKSFLMMVFREDTGLAL